MRPLIALLILLVSMFLGACTDTNGEEQEPTPAEVAITETAGDDALSGEEVTEAEMGPATPDPNGIPIRLGEEVTEAEMGPPTHDPNGIPIRDGDPLPGGMHDRRPLTAGFYEAQIADGAAIHALEHGLIWIAYQPDLVTPEDIEALRGLQDRFSRDVVVSPRPQNESPVAALSWGRILRLDFADDDLLNGFVRSNRDRSPEPGIR